MASPPPWHHSSGFVVPVVAVFVVVAFIVVVFVVVIYIVKGRLPIHGTIHQALL